MRRGLRALAALVGFGALATMCRPAPTDRAAEEKQVVAERSRSLQTRLAGARDTAAPPNGPLARWILPATISEISGLALTADDRLLAHDDEHGTVYEIDYRGGIIVKKFAIGDADITADFEGIAAAGERIFLVTSSAKLYEFREGSDGERVAYTLHDTEMGKECEVEGLGYDDSLRALLLACKNTNGAAFKDALVVLRWAVDDGRLLDPLVVPWSEVLDGTKWEKYHPSGIELSPRAGSYLVPSAEEGGLVEISRDGRVLNRRELPRSSHEQPEGIALTRDGVLIISDETRHRPGVITLYAYPSQP